MLLLKIWILTVVVDIVWRKLTRQYYKNNPKARLCLVTNPYPWHIKVNAFLTCWNTIGLFLVLIYFLFMR